MLQGISGVVLVAPSLPTDLAVADAINRVYIYKHIKLCVCIYVHACSICSVGAL